MHVLLCCVPVPRMWHLVSMASLVCCLPCLVHPEFAIDIMCAHSQSCWVQRDSGAQQHTLEAELLTFDNRCCCCCSVAAIT